MTTNQDDEEEEEGIVNQEQGQLITEENPAN
jgi:hypothetical protein